MVWVPIFERRSDKLLDDDLFSDWFRPLQLFEFLQASLNAGLDLEAAVVLPGDEDEQEWLAVHGKSRLAMCQHLMSPGRQLLSFPTLLCFSQFAFPSEFLLFIIAQCRLWLVAVNQPAPLSLALKN
jgi:hypothetical protein